MSPRLERIHVYPLKSASAVPRSDCAVEPRGLALDRRWMLVDPCGRFVTARSHPRLVRVRVAVDDRTLTVEAPGMRTLAIPRDGAARRAIEVEIWGDTLSACAVDPAADEWFSRFLGTPLRLVHMTAADRRALDPSYARAGDEVSFADGFPVLLISQASLGDLQARSPLRLSMRRFRPNLTVAGCEPFAEDGWRRVRIGEVEFEAPKPCDRCVMTTIDPYTAEVHPDREPLRTLARYRRDRERGILFGVNLIPRGTGQLRTGDAITVLD